MPTVLLIGGQFNSDEPWAQMTGLLGLSCTREEFLGALEAAAQARGTRAVILIDALNEGQGKVTLEKAPCWHPADRLEVPSGWASLLVYAPRTKISS